MGAYDAAVLADGAVHYWRLEEPSGNALDTGAGPAVPLTTVVGGVTRTAAGLVAGGGKAYTFNGSTGYVASTAGLTLPTPRFTAEFWMLAPPMGGFAPIWNNTGNPTTGPPGALVFALQDGKVGTGISADGADGVVSAGRVDDSQRHHVVLRMDGTGKLYTLYVDGVLSGSAAFVTLPAPPASVILLGSEQYGTPNFYFTGTLDEIAIYPTLLTPAQIGTHYALGTAVAGGGIMPWDGRLPVHATRWVPITPNDSADLPAALAGLWVGGAGDVAILGDDGVVSVVAGVRAGTILTVTPARVRATGTTATNLVGLQEL